MNKPIFSFATYGKGTYKWATVEKSICLRVAKKAVRAAGYSDTFACITGHSFSGSGADRQLLPPDVRRRVDETIVKSMRRSPVAWKRSQISRVAEERPWANNLILNQGLDQLASNLVHWGNIGAYCVLGTGTATPVFTNTGLVAEVVRTNNTLGTGTNFVDSVPTRTRTYTRTFDFPAEVANRNYAELGLSYSATVTNNLCTRTLVDGGTATVLTGQQARVVYALAVTLGANVVSTPTSATGWTSGLQGTSAFCTLDTLPILTGGGSGVGSFSGLVLSTTSTIPVFGTQYTPGTTSTSTSSGLNAYTTGSYIRTRWCSWDLSSGIGTWRALHIYTGYSYNACAWVWVFDNAQTKDSQHTLTVNWSMSYGRI